MTKTVTSDQLKLELDAQSLTAFRGDDLTFKPYEREAFIETFLSSDHVQFFTHIPNVIYELERVGPDTWTIEQHPYKKAATA